jgi:hypothetical protein
MISGSLRAAWVHHGSLRKGRVYTSIVIAIWLRRLIRMAMRGCTSSAASKVAQVRRAS